MLRSGALSGTCVDNLSYCSSEYWQRSISGGFTEGTQFTILENSPFESMDFANGVFVKTAAAASYGATR